MADQMEFIKSCSNRFLDMLDEYNVRITFFVTGEYYCHFPEIVARINDSGHEIAYHGHTHNKIINVDILRQELAMSSDFLNTFSPKGFRAPWIYLPEFMLPILADAGFEYDSSTLASAGTYGNINGMHILPVTSIPFFSHKIRYGKVVNLKILRQEIPIGTGIMVSYFRKWFNHILNRYSHQNLSCIFYLHLWQIYPPPAVQYHGLRRIHSYSLEEPLRRWLQDHSFGKMLELTSGSQAQKHFLTIDLEI